MVKECSNCKKFYFDIEMNSFCCKNINYACRNLSDFCVDWEDKFADIRVDNWREDNLQPIRKERCKMLDKFNKYMWKKHRVWLWTSSADAHDIVGGHYGWKERNNK